MTTTINNLAIENKGNAIQIIESFGLSSKRVETIYFVMRVGKDAYVFVAANDAADFDKENHKGEVFGSQEAAAEAAHNLAVKTVEQLETAFEIGYTEIAQNSTIPNQRHYKTKKMSEVKSISKRVLLNELAEQNHPVPVEDVIFWALEHYCTKSENTMGKMVAYSIKERILEAEERAKQLAEKKALKKAKKCFNCKHASCAFKLSKITHHYCHHISVMDKVISGEIDSLDTLKAWHGTCELHEDKLESKKPTHWIIIANPNRIFGEAQYIMNVVGNNYMTTTFHLHEAKRFEHRQQALMYAIDIMRKDLHGFSRPVFRICQLNDDGTLTL